MKKTSMLVILAASLLAAPALAQDKPAASAPEPAASAAEKAASALKFIAKQPADQMLASKYIGLTVKNPGGAVLGGINDLMFNEQGQITAALIGVGGFLGIGEKNVAVPFDAFKTSEADGNKVLILDVSKEALQKAPDFHNVHDKPVSVTKRLSEDAAAAYQQGKKEAKDAYATAKAKTQGAYEAAKAKTKEVYGRAKEQMSGEKQ